MNFLKIITLLSLTVVIVKLSGSNRRIDIENDSKYPINIVLNTADLKIDHQVPAYSHSNITAQVSSIPNLGNTLLNAIVDNSVAQIINAIRSGANVNLEICGKRPLAWAIAFGHIEAIKCLVMYGANL